MRTIAFVLALVLSACSTTPGANDYWQRGQDYPLTRIEVVETANIAFWCRDSFRDLNRVRACASKAFSHMPELNVCYVYILPLWKDTKSILEHEFCHCLGYDHDELYSNAECPVPVTHLTYTRSKI